MAQRALAAARPDPAVFRATESTFLVVAGPDPAISRGTKSE